MNRSDYEKLAKYLDPKQRLGLGSYRRCFFSFKPYNDARMACRPYEAELSKQITDILKGWDRARGCHKKSWFNIERDLQGVIAQKQAEMNKNEQTCVVKSWEEPAEYHFSTPTIVNQYSSASKISEKFLTSPGVPRVWDEQDEASLGEGYNNS